MRKNLYTILSSFIYAFRYILIDFPAYIKLVVSILNTYYIGSRQNGKSILQFHIILFTIKLETWSILIQICSLILPYTDFFPVIFLFQDGLISVLSLIIIIIS